VQRLARRVAAVAWPAFLVASVLEIAVFAFVDPMTLHTLGGAALPLSAMAVYSIAFFLFWAATAAACALTLLLERAADEVNSGAPRGD
jgi:hypothetical protein